MREETQGKALLIRSIFLIFLISCLAITHIAFGGAGNKADLKRKIKKVSDATKGRIGVAVYGLDFGDAFVVNDSNRYPMQSTYKFPLALYMLKLVDEGRFSLDQKIHIAKSGLDTATWSPLVKEFPRQDIDISLGDLLRYTVSKSDNNGCDVLFWLAGGTTKVNDYIHGLGVKNISIAATEAEMKKAWSVQYTNWCRPSAMAQLLQLFYSGKLLSKASNDFLMNLMVESENSPNRLKGLLPKDATVAHKTGTSNTNARGVTAATNDIGIVTLPDGRHYAIAVYVSDYKGGVVKGERAIAEISRLAWDYFTGTKS